MKCGAWERENIGNFEGSDVELVDRGGAEGLMSVLGVGKSLDGVAEASGVR